MKRSLVILSALALFLSCTRTQESTSTTSTTSSVASAATQETQAAAPPSAATQPATSAAATPVSAPASAPAPSGSSLASQDTNWPGITAEVTEFRRKGNTLTAKVRFTNKGSESPEVGVIFKEVYLVDTANGKKYETLKDEKGAYIASLHSGWEDRWHEYVKPGQSQSIWMKFPAPPVEVKAITLQIPKTPPFEDLAIQD